MVQPQRDLHGEIKRVRSIIQIAIGDCDGSPFVVALCNDGTAWKLMHDDRWAALPRIPQGEAPDVGPKKGAIKWE